MENSKLKDKRILVTGGARGIGASLVKILKSERAKIFMMDKKETRVNDKIIDIRNNLEVRDFIEKLPLLNGLVLNAGLGPFHENPLEIFETNVLGNLNVLRASMEKLAIFSSVVIVSSTAGYRRE